MYNQSKIKIKIKINKPDCKPDCITVEAKRKEVEVGEMMMNLCVMFVVLL